jgi:hypothetical protein
VTWPLLGFLTFVGLCALFIGWFIDRAQKALDRHMDMDADAMREAMKRMPP